MHKLIWSFILIISSCSGNENNTELFKGENGYAKKTANFVLSEQKSKFLVDEYLDAQDKTFYSHPYEVVMTYRNGYLFIIGDFKSFIRLKGYYVDSLEKVSYIDLKRKIPVKKYQKRVNRINNLP